MELQKNILTKNSLRLIKGGNETTTDNDDTTTSDDENYETLSNILKVKHDTAKAIINNIR